MNSYQALALAALRNADESMRLQGQAFKAGKMCACAVIINAISPKAIDVQQDSAEGNNAAAVYNFDWKLLGGLAVRESFINLNDDRNPDKTPKYTFAQIADAMEEKWSAE